jgi:hypothetical protein
MQLAESTDHPLAKEVLRDIADEERVHAGEFLRLPYELDPEEKRIFTGRGRMRRSRRCWPSCGSAGKSRADPHPVAPGDGAWSPTAYPAPGFPALAKAPNS